MDVSLAATALVMGLAGGPHCVAMCGAACAALSGRAQRPAGQGITLAVVDAAGRPASAPRAPVLSASLWLFQAGRLLGYSALGALAAASMQGLGWLSVHAAAIRPLWTLLHVAAAMLGLVLLWLGRQPAWLDEAARGVWNRFQALAGRSGVSGAQQAAPLLMGMAWAFLPCGLLYSALLVAALSPGVWQGAGVMALFAIGSGLSLLAGPWLWMRLKGEGASPWAIRLAGAALFAISVWALWMGLVHDTAPWCVVPA